MAEFDTSIYKTPPQQPIQPLNPMQVLQMLGQVNQNALFQQTYKARENVGNAYKGNINPDGTMNSRGLAGDIARTGGFLAGEALGTAVSNATSQATLDKQNVSYAQQTLGALATKKDLKPSDLANWAVIAKRAGVPANVVDELLDGAYASKDIKKFLTTQGVMSLGTAAMEPVTGTPDAPEAGGAQRVIPRGQQIQEMQGASPGMRTTNPVGAEVLPKASSDQMTAALQRSGNFAQEMFPINQSLAYLKDLGPEGTGPGTDELNKMKAFMKANLSFMPGVEAIEIDKIAKYEGLKKYLLQMAQSSPLRSAAPGTDLGLTTTLSSNPSTNLSQLGATELTKAVAALRTMEEAQIREAKEKGVKPYEFTRWSSDWARNQDVRAYMFPSLNDEERERVKKSLKTKAEKERFTNSYNTALRNGLIERE